MPQSWDVYTWVLGNPRILRQGEDQYLGIWDVLGTLVLYHVTWDSIVLYERVLPFLDMSGRIAYIFIARGV